MKNNNLTKNIKYSDTLLIKGALIPFMYIIIMLILFVVFIKTGFGKYIEQRKLINQAKITENILSEKVKYLNDNQSLIKTDKDLLTVALPEKNPVLLVMSQIRNIQASNNTVITDIRVSGANSKAQSINSLSMKISVEGQMEEIAGFIDILLNTLPILQINRAVFSAIGVRYTADITLSTYWEGLPSKISAVTDPIKKLSNDELAIISQLQSMKMPGINQVLPQSPTQRANPFNQ